MFVAVTPPRKRGGMWGFNFSMIYNKDNYKSLLTSLLLREEYNVSPFESLRMSGFSGEGTKQTTVGYALFIRYAYK